MKKVLFIAGILAAQLSFAQLYTSGGVVNQSATPNSPNVGIGISNPQSKLTVYEGGGAGSNNFELRTNHLRNPDRYFMKNIIFGTGTEDITFSLRHDGQMYVGGNVGIGSANPQAKLEVASEITNDKNFVMAQFLGSGASGGSNIVSIGFHNKANLEINSAYASSGLRYGNFADFNIENDSDSPTYGSINFITNKKIQMAIRPNGNALLNGKLEAKEIKVTLTPTADFVFEENYDLPKLEEVAKHIKEKKHLPEIASAKVMEKEGVNVGEFQIKLLQKIEELTLYAIKQDKQLKDQEEKIQKLETENSDLKNLASEIKQLKEQVLTMKSNTTH
ncbi:hypothetical protein [Chryseobacterium culicis]|uniref:Cell wall anchor protein n=1 Tax=Chryseobacterium culicis TaxID=680127 RepID=A0A1H6IPN5_CHRCI|nr:hypothetical protein [Chryseobacterium culicis]SEH49450.1 hypothetical protein SAMN05421593_0130 [Chryseobacterium culicis]